MEDTHPDDAVKHERKQNRISVPEPPYDPASYEAKNETDRRQEGEIKALADKIRAGERWLIWLTAAMAFFALCSVVVGILQWLTSTGQLTQMQGGSKQTDDLIKATQAMATAASKQADAAAMQLAAIRQTNDIALKTYRAANRPYYGVEGIRVAHARSKQIALPASDQPIANETDILIIVVSIKNSGSVAATKATIDWDVTLNGVPMEGMKVPDSPHTVQPGGIRSRRVDIGTRDYSSVMQGATTVRLRVSVEYDGPSGHYKECSISQYIPKLNAFFDLGGCK